MLQPIVQKLHSKNSDIEILTDFPSFEYKKLGLKSKNIHQIFGEISPDLISEEMYLKKSNSKNPAYFIPINVIVLSKESNFFEKSPKKVTKELLESLETIKALNSGKYGYQKVAESKDFIIYAKI